MKKSFSLLLAWIMALSLVACGSSTNTPTPDDKNTPTDEQTKGESKGKLGDYAVQFTGFSLAKDYEGNDAIIVTYDFTNNSEETTSAMTALVIRAYQDGVQLSSAILMDAPDGYDAESEMKNIKNGATLSCQTAFVLSSTSSPVEVEAEELFSFSDDQVTYTCTLG